MTITLGFQIAAGFDNAAGLAALETTFPVYRHHPLLVRDAPFDDGILRGRADKLNETTGFASFDWLVDFMSETQYNYWQDTYTVGGTSYSGKVTARTYNQNGTLANYNAVLRLPKKSELTRFRDGFKDVRLHFIVEEAL